MAGDCEEKRAQGMYCDEGVKLEHFFFNYRLPACDKTTVSPVACLCAQKIVQIIIRRSEFGKPFAILR